jgi:hypothetical protein
MVVGAGEGVVGVVSGGAGVGVGSGEPVGWGSEISLISSSLG